ncbi:MAG TPA: hypothetical protein VF369_02120 [candidate division Zixibacteria bacterium]
MNYVVHTLPPMIGDEQGMGGLGGMGDLGELFLFIFSIDWRFRCI